MKPFHFRKLQKQPISQVLISLLLTLIITACGNIKAVNVPSGKVQTPSRVPSTVSQTINAPTSFPQFSDIPPNLNLNTKNISVAAGSLLIQSFAGFQCPYAQVEPPDDLELGHLVFTSDRTTYSQDEIAQMSSYFEDGNWNEVPIPGQQRLPPPPTLHWVLGGEIVDNTDPTGIPVGLPRAPAPSIVCGAELFLTNTGSNPIQIPKVSVQLKASPQQNMYQYHLIDMCSITISACSLGQGGGSGNCSAYFASIQLEPGAQNTVFSAVPQSNPGCATLTIPRLLRSFSIWNSPLRQAVRKTSSIRLSRLSQ